MAGQRVEREVVEVDLSPMTTGERIAWLRDRAGITNRNDLAQILGIAGQTLGNYERDERDVPGRTLRKLADFFGVSTDYLLGRRDTPPKLTGKRTIRRSPRKTEVAQTLQTSQIQVVR